MLKKTQQKYRRLKFRLQNNSPNVLYSKTVIVPKIYNASPIPITGNSDFEVHVLVSKRDFPAMLWGLYSFYYNSSKEIGLVVHDDGSLDEFHSRQLQTIFPGSSLIFRSFSDLKIDKYISCFPKCKEFRKAHPTHLKLIDFFFFSKTEKIIFFDSDIIFFKEPKQIINEKHNIFIEDLWTNYILSPLEIKSQFQINVPPKINTGFGKINKNCFDMNFLEFCLSNEKLGRGMFTSEQTLVAMLAAREGVKTASGAYKMDLKKGIQEKVVKHYTSVIRYLLYIEGIPWVNRNLLKQ